MHSPVKLALAAAACVALAAMPPQVVYAIDFSEYSDYEAGEVAADADTGSASTTKAPCPTLVQPTDAPEATTATPAETTATPAETTATPAETSAAPAETTAAPVSSKSPCPSLPQPSLSSLSSNGSSSGSEDTITTKSPCPSLPQATKTPCPSLKVAGSDSASADAGSDSADSSAASVVTRGVTVTLVAASVALLAV